SPSRTLSGDCASTPQVLVDTILLWGSRFSYLKSLVTISKRELATKCCSYKLIEYLIRRRPAPDLTPYDTRSRHRRTGVARGSCHSSSHSAPAGRGISRGTPVSARRPSGGPDVSAGLTAAALPARRGG